MTMGCNRLVLLGLVVVLAALMLPGVAGATVFSGSITYAAPQGQPSLNGPTPDPAQTSQYFDNVGATYDNASGTVTVSFGWYDPTTWGEPLTRVAFNLGYMGDPEYPAKDVTSYCSPTYDQVETLGSPVLSLVFQGQYGSPPPDDPYGPGPWEDNILYASLQGYTGSLTAPVTFNGTTFTAIIQAPQFVGHIWDCLTDDVNNIITPLDPPAPPPTPKHQCSNYRLDRYVTLHSVVAVGMSCSAVRGILTHVQEPPTASAYLRFGSPQRFAPKGWQFDPQASTFYTTVHNWVLDDVEGATEWFTAKHPARSFGFTWGHTSRWHWPMPN